MADEVFADPVLELARRIDSDDPLSVIALGTNDEEARVVLGVLDELDAETAASGIASRLRQQGHAL